MGGISRYTLQMSSSHGELLPMHRWTEAKNCDDFKRKKNRMKDRFSSVRFVQSTDSHSFLRDLYFSINVGGAPLGGDHSTDV